MDESLLKKFFQEEIDAYAKRQLLNAIREGGQTGSPVIRKINFDRFFVLLDFEARQVGLYDVTDVGPDAEYKLGIDEFERLLLSVDPSR